MPKNSNSTLVYHTEPFAYQKAITELSWQKPYWGLFMEMGTGKSKIMIDTFINLYLSGQVDTVLYVAKKGELANFQTYEIPAHKPPHVKITAMIYKGCVKKAEVQKIKHMLFPQPNLRVFSMNIEAIRSGRAYDIAEAYVRSSRKVMIIVDESTLLKDRRSSQSKAMLRLRKYAKFVRISTGTIMPHNPVDVFCQSLFLDRYALGYGGVTAFRSEFCEMEKQYFGNRVFNQQVGVKNLKILREKMKRIGTVLTKEDCLDLPDKIHQRKAVELSDEQIKHYQEIIDYHVTKIDTEFIECTNALSVMLRLHQVVCGQLKSEDKYHIIQNHRQEILKGIIDEVLENEKKVIVWSHYRAVSANTADYLSKHYGLVHLAGGLSMDDRSEKIKQFKEDENCRIFIGNPQSSGFGLTLTEAHTAIYYSNSDNYEHRLQSEDRIHRIGQEKKCLYIDLHSPGTVEDAILNRNKMKSINRGEVMKTDDFLKMVLLQ